MLMDAGKPNSKEKNYMLRRSIMDYGMGGLIVLCGVFFAFADKFADKMGLEVTAGPAFRFSFAGLCLLYGGFRMYRGYKKNYFSE